MTPPFIPGLELAGALYAEVVAPLLEDEPGRPRYAAALLGAGSEVLGWPGTRAMSGCTCWPASGHASRRRRLFRAGVPRRVTSSAPPHPRTRWARGRVRPGRLWGAGAPP